MSETNHAHAIPTPRRLSDAAAPDERVWIADHLPEELQEVLGSKGIRVDLTQARRVFAAAVQRGEPDFSQVKGLPKKTAEALAAIAVLPSLVRKDRRVSRTDGFVKELWSLSDGREIESVRIPIPVIPPDTVEGAAAFAKVGGEYRGKKAPKYVVCVSSQVGCALGCTFCATATLGFTRNLRPSEIVGQLVEIRRDADRPVRGVVFMGMGEPFQNYEGVIRAAKVISHPAGLAIDSTDITISTAGIVPAIRKYTADGHKFRLTVSLTSARPESRRLLMPIERKYPIEELVAAIKEHAVASRHRVTVAWVAIGGPDGNCTEAEAIALGERFRDVPIRLDLIDVNGSVAGHRPPTDEELDRFRDALDRHLKQPVVRRYSGGKDIDGACGMLAAKRGESSGLVSLGR